MTATLRLLVLAFSFGVLSAACLAPVNEGPPVSLEKGSGGSVDAGHLKDDVGAGLEPLTCTAGAWCWQHPTPQGQPLNTVFAVSSTEAWALGDHGATVHFVNGVWTAVKPITDLSLSRAWGTDGTNIWAVGQKVVRSQIAESALVHFDGTRWSTVPHGALPAIVDVTGSASGELWLLTAGTSTTIKPVLQRWNGTAFVETTPLPAGLEAKSVCVRSANEVWVTVADDRNSWPFALYRWNGTTWSLVHRLPAGSSRRFDSRVMCPADGIAVAQVFEFDSGKYAFLEARGDRVSFGAAPRGGALLRSAHGEVFSFDFRAASQWTATGWQPRFTLAADESMFSVAFDFIGGAGWLAKGSPTLSSWSGSAFTPSTSPVGTLRAFVSPGAAQDPVAVFGDGSWGRRSTAGWVFSATPTLSTGQPLRVAQAFSLPGGDAWLVGNAIAKYDATAQTLTPVLTPMTGGFTAIDGTDEATMWVVADRQVLRFDGRQWVAPTVPLPEIDGVRPGGVTFVAVEVRSATDVVLLGIEGGDLNTSVIYQWDGTAWSGTSSFGSGFAALERDSAGQLYIVDGDLVKKRAPGAREWTTMGRVSGSVLRLRVDATDHLEAVLRSDKGLGLSRWNATEARFVLEAPEVPLEGATDLMRGSGGATWALGSFGAVLRYEPPN